MVVSKGVKLGSAEIKEGVAISVNNIVTLALLQIDKVENLIIIFDLYHVFLTSEPSW